MLGRWPVYLPLDLMPLGKSLDGSLFGWLWSQRALTPHLEAVNLHLPRP